MISLGVNVPNFGPECDPASLLGWAQFAERHGFATLLVSDHVAPTAEVTSLYPQPFYDPFVALSWLSGQTTRLRLGTSVLVVPYRHPLLTARMSAELSVLSAGRFVLGVGVGWSRTEYEAVGVDFTDRGSITDEYLDIITRSWSDGHVVVPTPHTDGLRVDTRPEPQAGRVPLWVGGSSPPAVRRAVRFGAMWHPINPDRTWLRGTGLMQLRRAAENVGADVPGFVPRIKARHEPGIRGVRALGVGTTEQIVDDVVELAELGAAEVILDPNPDAPRSRDFAAEHDLLLDIKEGVERRLGSRPPRPESVAVTCGG